MGERVQLIVPDLRGHGRSSVLIVPNAGHGAVLGDKWPEFVKTAAAFLRG